MWHDAIRGYKSQVFIEFILFIVTLDLVTPRHGEFL